MSFSPVVNFDASLKAGDKVRFVLTYTALFGQTPGDAAQIIESTGLLSTYAIEQTTLVQVLTSQWRITAVVKQQTTPAEVAVAVKAAAESDWQRWSASVTEMQVETVGVSVPQPSTNTTVVVAGIAVVAFVVWWFFK